MRNSIIAAAAGVVASGFMMLGAPVANADTPCGPTGANGTQACSDCLQASARAGHTGDVGVPCGQTVPQNPGAVACQQAGLCG